MLDLESLTDTQLYELLRSPDKAVRERVFEYIYNHYGPRICEYCIRANSSDILGEDIFQDTMVRFYESIERYEEVYNIPAMLIRIARNIILNNKKKYKNVEFTSNSIEDTVVFEESEDTSLDDNDLLLQKKIRRAVHQLPNEYKEPFLMQLYGALTYQEIAEELQISVANVRNRIMRAKIKLRTILTPYLQQ